MTAGGSGTHDLRERDEEEEDKRIARELAQTVRQTARTSGMPMFISLFCHVSRSLWPYNRSLFTLHRSLLTLVLMHTSGMHVLVL